RRRVGCRRRGGRALAFPLGAAGGLSEQLREYCAEDGRRDRAGLDVALSGRLHAVVRALPKGPRERRREALTGVVRVAQAGRVVLAPRRAAEQLLELRACVVIEQEEVDLVRVLVLDDAPRKAPAAQQ